MVALTMGCAFAQDAEKIAPKELPLPPAPPPPALPPPQPPPLPAGTETVVPALIGVVFVPSKEALVPAGQMVAGVDTARVKLIDDPAFRAQIAPLIGQPVNFDMLNGISKQVIDWARAHDHAFVDVAIPEQDIESGTVQLVVTEFHLGRILVEGNQWFRTSTLTQAVSLEPGDEIVGAAVTESLNRLNANPFRRVQAVYRPGEDPGTTDLVLQTEDRLPLRTYLEYSNNGSPSTGRDRWQIGLNWGDALWSGHQLSYQLITSDDVWHHRTTGIDPENLGHSISYTIPLPWQDTLTIFGNYTRSVPHLGNGLDMIGLSGQASFRYGFTVPDLAGVHQDLQAGYDYKVTNNNLDFGGSTVSATSTEIHQLLIEDTASSPDPWGQLTLDSTFVYSPGNITSGDKDAQFNSAVPFARANYVYARLQFTRLTPLPEGFGALTRFTTQFADRNLLSSEQIGGGGSDIGRGYDERVINGTSGAQFSQEFRSPGFSLAKLIADQDWGDQTQLSLFFDYADVYQHTVATGDTISQRVKSTGLGLRYSIDRYLSIKLDYGFQLLKAPGADRLGQLAHLDIQLGD